MTSGFMNELENLHHAMSILYVMMFNILHEEPDMNDIVGENSAVEDDDLIGLNQNQLSKFACRHLF